MVFRYIYCEGGCRKRVKNRWNEETVLVRQIFAIVSGVVPNRHIHRKPSARRRVFPRLAVLSIELRLGEMMLRVRQKRMRHDSNQQVFSDRKFASLMRILLVSGRWASPTQRTGVCFRRRDARVSVRLATWAISRTQLTVADGVKDTAHQLFTMNFGLRGANNLHQFSLRSLSSGSRKLS